MKIAAVVVTYNRLAMLKECVRSLLSQTYQPDTIMVINNGSTDGTIQWLNEQKGIKIFHQENLGSSGGYHKGIEWAYNEGYDWIWAMDDDSEPDINCLENCSALFDKGGVDVVAPLVVKSTSGEVDVMHRGLITENFWKLKHDPLILKSNKINTPYFEEVDFISFVGPIYSRQVIEQIGLPKKEFFLHQDDFEYSLRIKDAGLKSVLVYSAIIMHKEAAHIHVKSRLGFNHPSSKDKLFIKYFSPRNLAYIMRKRQGFLSAVIISLPAFSKEFVRHIFSKPSLLPSRLKHIFSAIKDGVTLNLDNSKPKRIVEKFKN